MTKQPILDRLPTGAEIVDMKRDRKAKDLGLPSRTPPDPLFYVDGRYIFQRPVHKQQPDGSSSVTMGFRVCEVCPGVKPQEVCDILNKGERP